MVKFGWPDRFITIVRQFYDGMTAKVLDDGDCCDAFLVPGRVKQGSKLSDILFSMIFSAMLTDAFQGNNHGVHIKYRTDGRLFNLYRLQAVTRAIETLLRDLVFADDYTLNADSETEMQVVKDKLSTT